MSDRIPLHGDRFRWSYLVKMQSPNWPRDFEFSVWSTHEATGFKITCEAVLEQHFIVPGSTGVMIGDGIELSGIDLLTDGPLFQYWKDYIAEGGWLPKGQRTPPVCVEFCSHVFGNREKELFRRDRDTGLLIVCRHLHVEEDRNYPGPFPYPKHMGLDRSENKDD